MIKQQKAIVLGYMVLGVLVLFPLTLGFVSEGSLTWQWLGLVETGLSVYAKWVIFEVLLQELTIVASALFFRSIFPKRPFLSFMGVLLYVTCPFRVAVSYDPFSCDLGQAIVLLFLPIAGLLINSIANGKYAIFIGQGVVVTLGLLIVLFLAAAVLGAIYAGLPREVSAAPLADSGYQIHEMFHLFVYNPGHPGMGSGIILCLLLGLWLMHKKGFSLAGDATRDRKRACLTASVLLLLALSLQKLSSVYHMLFGSFAVSGTYLFGIAQLGLCVLGTLAVERSLQQKEDIYRVGMPLAVILLCAGSLIYQCNMFTYVLWPF